MIYSTSIPVLQLRLVRCVGDDDAWRKPQNEYSKPFWVRPYKEVFSWIKKVLFQKPVNGMFTGKGLWPSTPEQDDTYTVVVMNIGAHGSGRFSDPIFVKEIVDAASGAMIDKFIWKTTTKKAYFVPIESLYRDPNREVNYYKHDYAVCGVPNVTCFNTSWTKKVNHTSLMWDSLHFLAPVYNHLNVQLMKLL
jgi:hypothetical protein